jgi:hypothetical protein
MRDSPNSINASPVALSHIDAALAALGRALESHGAACVCQACTALASAVQEAEAVSLALAYLHERGCDGDAQAQYCLKEVRDAAVSL